MSKKLRNTFLTTSIGLLSLTSLKAQEQKTHSLSDRKNGFGNALPIAYPESFSKNNISNESTAYFNHDNNNRRDNVRPYLKNILGPEVACTTGIICYQQRKLAIEGRYVHKINSSHSDNTPGPANGFSLQLNHFLYRRPHVGLYASLWATKFIGGSADAYAPTDNPDKPAIRGTYKDASQLNDNLRAGLRAKAYIPIIGRSTGYNSTALMEVYGSTGVELSRKIKFESAEGDIKAADKKIMNDQINPYVQIGASLKYNPHWRSISVPGLPKHHPAKINFAANIDYIHNNQKPFFNLPNGSATHKNKSSVYFSLGASLTFWKISVYP